MAEVFHLQVITPGERFYDGEVSMVELATTEGRIGVYKNHIPLTALAVPGILTIHDQTGTKTAGIQEGFLEILPEKTTILVDGAKWENKGGRQRRGTAVTSAEP